MSGFSGMALPGKIPSAGSGRNQVVPENLFKNNEEKDLFQKMIDGVTGGRNQVAFKSVNVKIFDLSDPKQLASYEKLWLSLLDKLGRGEVVVDTRKDLVHRADGTSYWMKYVEYAEFGASREDSEKDGKSKGRNGK